MSFLKRIFGFLSRTDNEASISRPAPAVAARPAEPSPRSVLISWHEMLDAQSRIAGYFLPASPVRVGAAITGQQLLDSFITENVMRLAEKRLVVMPVSIEQWQGANFGCLVAARTYFHLSVATSISSPEVDSFAWRQSCGGCCLL
jgi:hypothetical protein